MATRNTSRPGSIERLSAREERTVSSAERVIQELSAKSSPTTRQSERLREAIAKKDKAERARNRLAELASTDNQKERYGRSRWNRDFRVVGEITFAKTQNYSGLTLTDRELQNLVVKAISSTPFWRFQKAFCKPKDFVVPPFYINKAGKIAFYGLDFEGLRKLSVAGCLVSPDRISDSLVEALCIHRFSEEEKKDDHKKLAIKASSRCVDAIKLAYDSGRFLGGAQYRVLALRAPAPEVAARFRHAPRLSDEAIGTVLYFRHEVASGAGRKDRSRAPDWRYAPGLLAQDFPNIMLAHRRSLHAGESYVSEHQDLAKLFADVTRLRSRISTNWTSTASDATKQRIVDEVRATIDPWVERLEQSIDPKKRRAKELLGKVREVRDETNRPNPTASCSVMTAALASIEKRTAELIRKSAYTEEDRKLLLGVAIEQGTVLVEFRRALEGGVARLNAYPPRARVKAEKNDYLDALVPGRKQLSDLSVQPFLTFGSLLARGVHELDAALQRGSINDSRVAAEKMHVVCRLSALAVAIATLEERLSYPDKIETETVLGLWDKAIDRATGSLLPTVTLPAFKKPLADLVAQMVELGQQVRSGLEARPTAKAEIFAEAKEALGKLAVQETASRLSI